MMEEGAREPVRVGAWELREPSQRPQPLRTAIPYQSYHMGYQIQSSGTNSFDNKPAPEYLATFFHALTGKIQKHKCEKCIMVLLCISTQF